MLTQGRVASCHPGEKHYARGLCTKCYTVATKDERSTKRKAYREANKEKVKQQKSSYYERNRAKILSQQKAKYNANPDVIKSRVAAYKAKNPEVVAERKRKSYAKVQEATLIARYGMTLKDVEEMLEAQGRKCAVCESEIDMETKRVDHCHQTGFVRGLLCWNCNTAIGKLGDTYDGVKKALDYLGREPSKFKA